MIDLATTVESSTVWRLCVALAIGLLLGIERERRKDADAQTAGLRGFTLVAFLGGLASQSGLPLVVGIVLLFVALVAVAMYATRATGGATTEIALVLAAVLGVLAQSRPALSLAGGVVVAVIVYSRIPLHRFAREHLTEQDLRDGLILGAAALVVLPALPDRAIDPFGLVNPFALWRLAVVLMSVSAFSHVATRLLGPKFGLLLTGLAGGFVSSTAVIAAMGARASKDARLIGPCAVGANAAILGSLIYLAALVGAADPVLMLPLLRPFAVAGGATLCYLLALALYNRHAEAPPQERSRAFDMRTALLFVALVAVFSLISWAGTALFGPEAVVAGVIATALIDAHAAAVSVATLVASNHLGAAAGVFAILTGFSANMLAKAPAAFAIGPTRYGVQVTAGLTVLVAGLWAGWSMA